MPPAGAPCSTCCSARPPRSASASTRPTASASSREWVTVATRFGAVRVKVARRGAAVMNAAPEYEDCAARAAERERRRPGRACRGDAAPISTAPAGAHQP
ncbi:MAG: LarC family nickel insertion protein [Ignavibacteriales bacterium]|nr:LarC family nickel insertion protein [Ignavibacteriales bacterium]